MRTLCLFSIGEDYPVKRVKNTKRTVTKSSMENTKKKIQYNTLYHLSHRTLVFGIVALLIFCTVTISAYKIISFQIKPTIETPRSEMKKLPPDVKKALEKPMQASVSATFHVPILLYHYV